MIKPCKFCHNNFQGPANKLYCKSKCKKSFENSLRAASGKQKKGVQSTALSANIKKPPQLDGYAAAFWDKTAPVLITRGHLNILSEDAFAELCDLVNRLRDINIAINASDRSLLQSGDKHETEAGAETQPFKESALSDIKRKYSNLLLVYCKQFYLTPLSNRGNFGMPEEGKDPFDEFMKGKNAK
jgi:phage terminase small subunit